MKLYLLTQGVNNDYDTYDSAVVVAENEDAARAIHPSPYHRGPNRELAERQFDMWANPSDVQVTFLADLPADSQLKAGDVVCASFNAG